jgi:hypothetical protein
MFNHTPGPWVLNGYQIERTTGIARTIGVVRSKRVLGTDSAAQTEQEALANARLLAAAPDMLEALHTMSNFVCIALGHMPDETRLGYGNPHEIAKWHFDFVQAVIALAQGESA